ncbi:MAG: glycerol-3-phosphate acyltransferase PlsY [Planctomycetota bacterium]|jgi:glycerol-3-phosphate acyltransferase PlsY
MREGRATGQVLRTPLQYPCLVDLEKTGSRDGEGYSLCAFPPRTRPMLPVISVDSLAAITAPTGAGWLVVFAGYLLGSVPFGLLLGRLKGIDIRKVGSGNIGATNVGRALGRPWALASFLLDFAKGLVPSMVLAPLVAEPGGATATLAVLAGSAAVVGHCYPLYLSFKGGKGVATGCGVLVGIDPVIFLIGGLVWLLLAAIFRYVSLASLVMGLSFPVVAWFRQDSQGYGLEVVLGALALCLLIFLRHRENIGRLLAGTESRIGKSKGPMPNDGATTDQIKDGQTKDGNTQD